MGDDPTMTKLSRLLGEAIKLQFYTLQCNATIASFPHQVPPVAMRLGLSAPSAMHGIEPKLHVRTQTQTQDSDSDFFYLTGDLYDLRLSLVFAVRDFFYSMF
jgi:hypothetical protein